MSVLETTDTASADPVLVRRDGPAARITLNRPAQRNALSLELMREVTAALRDLAGDADVRAIVIDGAGPAFCAGHDLGEMVGRDLAYYQHVLTPGVKIGLFCSTPMVPLSRAIGRKRALEMLLTGAPIDAATALEWGLVNRVVPADALDATVADVVAAIARSSSLTVGIGKRAFYDQIDLDESRAYDLTKTVMSMNMLAADAQEGICAFLEKREPTWTGR
jgi:enoyl-CoA hydratase/carnithine racemase